MRIGVRRTRRLVAATAVSLITLLATGTGADAAQLQPFKTFSQVGSGQVLGLQLGLPSAVVDAVNGVVGGVAGNITNPIDEVVAFTRSLGQQTTSRSGTGLGQALKGTLDDNLNKVTQAVFNRKLPIASAVLGGIESVTDELASVNLLSDVSPTAPQIVHVGVMEVTATAKNHPSVAGAVQSSGSTRIVGLTIDLTAEIKEILKGVLDPVLAVTDGVDGAAGLLDTLNTGVFDQIEEIAADLGLDVSLNVPDLADLLDRPLLSIGLIETSSATDAVGIARNALGRSKIVNLNILGTSKENALVHVDSIESKAFAQINGTAGGAVSDAVHTIVGLSVLDNDISVTNNQIKILGKTLPLPLDVVNELTEVLGGTLGLEIKVLETQEQATATYARSIANTLRISFHPTIAGLGNQLGLDLTTPSAMAEVSGNIVGRAPGCPGGVCPTTGLADGAYFLAGPALIGMAVLVRKFALAR